MIGRMMLAATVAVTVGCATAVDVSAQNKGSETYRQLNLFGDVFERVRSD